MRILALFGALLLCCVDSACAQSQTLLPDIIAQLQQEQHKLHSATVEGSETMQTTPDFFRLHHLDTSGGGSFLPPPQNRPFRWAFKNDKHFKEYTDPGVPKGPNERYELSSMTCTEIYDGKQSFDLIASHYKGRNDPALSGSLDQKDLRSATLLTFGYQVQNQWIADVLQSGRFVSCGVLSDPTWGRLEGFSEDKAVQYGTQRTTLWLAPRYGWLGVRWEGDYNTTVQGSHSHTVVECNLEKVEQRDGILFPTQGTVRSYGIENDQKILLSSQTLSVNSFTLNNVPDSLFEIKFAPGLTYTDVATQEYFHIGPNGEKISIDLHGQERVPQRSVGWVFMLSATTLLCLGMGVLWRKQKRGLSV